jgi:hypothetical protein
LGRCIDRLATEGIVRLPAGATRPQELFVKQGVGKYRLALTRGPYFDRQRGKATPLSSEESPLVDPLRSIGFDDAAIRRILREYRPHIVREWADITLAAMERHGDEFFKKSPAAYFVDNVRHAAAGTRTAPDWWRELRREESGRLREADREHLASVAGAGGAESEEQAFRAYLEGEAHEAFQQVAQRLTQDLIEHGKSRDDAEESGTYMARLHFLNRFRREHPQTYRDGFERLDVSRLRNKFGQ